MAVAFLLLGSLLGFAAALIGWKAFDLSLLAGLGLWSAVGLLVPVLALALSQLRATRRRERPLDRSKA